MSSKTGVRRASPGHSILRHLRNAARSWIFRLRWRYRNPDNYTEPASPFRIQSVSVGRGTYGKLNVVDDGGDSRLTLGSYCSIADDVVFLLNANHPVDRLSTYPFAVKYFHSQKSQALSKGDITVGPDCWIGYGALILSGVTLGQGAVVAAGAVVSGSIPAFAVVGGVPARVLRYRFSEEIRNELAERDFNEVLDYILGTDPSALERSVDASLKAAIRGVPRRNKGRER